MHRLTEFSLRRPWLTLAVLLAITVGLRGGDAAAPEKKYGYRVLDRRRTIPLCRTWMR